MKLYFWSALQEASRLFECLPTFAPIIVSAEMYSGKKVENPLVRMVSILEPKPQKKDCGEAV